MNTTPITSQPTAQLRSMDLGDEKRSPYFAHSHPHIHDSGCEQSDLYSHRTCHKSRRRRLVIHALLTLSALASIIAISCWNDIQTLNIFGSDDGLQGIGKRAVGNSNGSTLVDKKYYLIIVFVGLVLVLIAGLCLSAWCCKGSFQNPLCCPCYLCACCGGLACLECIGCGLCAEGLENV